MNLLDRYLLTQLLGPFGFFTLALAGIFWLAQVLPLVEIIIDNGRAGFIFLEFSALILPNVLVIVFPVAAFIATIYTVNRMFSDSEMVVVMSAGLSPLKIAKATFVFGMMVMAAMYVLILLLQPIAITRLGNQIQSLRQNAAAALLREKQFMHPIDGVTIYIRESSNIGEISGLFLHDQRDLNYPSTYSADQALLLQDEDELRLVMSHGSLQRHDRRADTLNAVDFEQFVFDLSDLVKPLDQRNRAPIEYKVPELLNPQGIIDSGGNRDVATYMAEAHNKIALPLLGLVLPMIAVSLMLSAKYKRSGFGARITLVALLGLLTIAFTLMIKTWVIANPDAYLISYLPAALACIFAASSLITTSYHRGGQPR